MNDLTLKENAQAFAVKAALNYLEKDPDKNIPKLLGWADKFEVKDVLLPHRKALHEMLDIRQGNWYELLSSLWTDIDSQIQKHKGFVHH